MTEDVKEPHEELRNALRREAPPAGFAERVLNRLAEEPVAVASWHPASAGLVRPKADAASVEPIRPKADAPPAGWSNRLRAPGASASLAEAREQLLRAEAEGPALHGVANVEARSRLPLVQWAAAAALVAAVAGGFDYVAKQEQRAEGEAARERVVLALHIAGSKLQLVQTKINRLHEQPEKNSNQ